MIFVSIGNAVSPYVSQNYGAKKIERIKKGYHAALVLDVCFAVLAFVVIETLHTQISSLFLGKDGTALAYQVSGDYMRNGRIIPSPRRTPSVAILIPIKIKKYPIHFM